MCRYQSLLLLTESLFPSLVPPDDNFEQCKLPGSKNNISCIIGGLCVATLSNPSLPLDMHSPILFLYGHEQGNPFTTVSSGGQYPLLCTTGDNQMFWMIFLFVIPPAPAVRKCHLLVLTAELSEKCLSVPSLVLQNNPIIIYE